VAAFPFRVLIARFGSHQASVTALSMICRCALLQCGQVKVRKSCPVSLGSIAESFIGEPQAVHLGPWFCASSIGVPSIRRSKFAVKPTGCRRYQGIGCSDVDLNVIASRAFEQTLFETNWPR
jgi:hypothetical protein